jgi:hypothetical protein
MQVPDLLTEILQGYDEICWNAASEYQDPVGQGRYSPENMKNFFDNGCGASPTASMAAIVFPLRKEWMQQDTRCILLPEIQWQTWISESYQNRPG